MGFDYIPKVGKINVYTLNTADGFVQILTPAQAKGIRGIKIKSRFARGSAPKAFDLARSATPDEDGDVTDGNGVWTNLGGGLGDSFGPSNGLWAQAKENNTIIEVMIFE